MDRPLCGLTLCGLATGHCVDRPLCRLTLCGPATVWTGHCADWPLCGLTLCGLAPVLMEAGVGSLSETAATTPAGCQA